MNAARTGRLHDFHKPHLFKDIDGVWHVVGGAGWDEHMRAYEAATELNARRVIRRMYFRPDDFFVWVLPTPDYAAEIVAAQELTWVDHPQLGQIFVYNHDLETA
jgi:hypothetical protein